MPRALLATVAFATVLAGCGGGDAGPADRAPRADRPAPPPAPEGMPGPEAPAPEAARLPADVPTAPEGPPPPGAERVIRSWLSAVRAADLGRAADVFARSARVQNGGPVLRLSTRRSAVTWNAALPCGAVLSRIRGARGYAVVRFRLVDRPGADCGSGTGAPAYGAIRVRDGRITDWFRLPGPVAPPDAPSGPFV